MKPSRAMPSRGLAASLLATTSLAALLLGGAPALAGGLSFDGQTQASVTNPANTTITSIVINNSTVTGAVTNAGTISPGKAGAGDATSSPSGQSYQGHAEAGYHWALPAAGLNVSVTPYAALDYVNAHVSGFSETGGFGALSVNAADSNSFQTTLGLRLTSRIQVANAGTLVPELRLGWSHEFLDASQKITAALVGVPGSAFSSTGIAFGRDAALIGAGFSMELAPDAKVFVDYDGKLGQRLQEHSVSGGLKVKF